MPVAASLTTAFLLEVGSVDVSSPDPFSFVELPIGTFLMGGSDEDRYVSAVELPRKEVEIINRIAMGRSPVTVCEWARFRRAEAPRTNGSCSPVTGISWDEACEYAHWLSVQSGRSCRLPTEAEWEFAARGGNDALFPSGRNRLSLNEANYLYDEMGHQVGRGYITPIGSYPPNPFGLFDMSGNICEWTASPWTRSPGEESATPGRRYVTKGGAWDQLPRTMRCSSRDWALRDERYDNLGFRVVIDLD
ncbi:MAG: SUMF1/EgtB/PvdO family nonheme iron enzyme [Verrucomicrobiales bacterium]|nr:SUMF1/EgtB/PvdO family nonheme iron enzyme [Verrucomicrobiales bacterium]